LEYIIEGCKDVDEQDVEQAFLSIGSGEAREVYMTLAERLIEEGKREGRLEGKREGRLEGKLLEKQEVLLKLLTQKFAAVADTDKRKIMGIRDLLYIHSLKHRSRYARCSGYGGASQTP